VTRINRWVSSLACVAGLALVVAGCGGKAPTEKQPPAPGKETISVMGPCGQVGPLGEVVKAWEKQNPGVELNWVPENMVTIVKKILDGKETPDVVLTMGDLEMDKLQQAGALLEGTRAKIAENALAITTPGSNPAKVKGIADLAKPAVKMISIPNPEYNSVGKHAIEALKAAGIWAQVEKKAAFPEYAADGKEVAAAGQVEAAIGYYPCVTEVHVPGQAPAKPKNLNLVGMIPQNLYPPFSCEAAVLKNAKNPEGGKKLLALLQSPEVHEFYVEWSFVNQEPPKPVAGE
jgi:molybdenum ABC transporter molybdate-binding protein